MNKKYSIVLFVFILALSGVATAQDTPIQPTHTPSPPSSSFESYGHTAANQRVCTTAIPMVQDNIRTQLSMQSATGVTIVMATPNFVYKSVDLTHCVVQLYISGFATIKYHYTLNYDVTANGVDVFSIYDGQGTPPVHLYTWEEFRQGMSPAQAVDAFALEKQRQQFNPYLDLLFNPNTNFTSHIEIYKKLCDVGLTSPALIKKDQAQKLLDILMHDMNVGLHEAEDSGYYGDIPPVYCVLDGIYPENVQVAFKMLDATRNTILVVGWAIDEINKEGPQANDMLPTALKWYRQTRKLIANAPNGNPPSEVTNVHEALVHLILKLAGNNTAPYLKMMTDDPDPEVAKTATDDLLNLITQSTPTGPSQWQQVQSGFYKEIQAAIVRANLYPRDAILSGETGTVQVSYDYLDGKVSNVKVVKSSGTRSLDHAAVSAVEKANYPLPPAGLAGKLLHLTIGLNYNLGGG